MLIRPQLGESLCRLACCLPELPAMMAGRFLAVTPYFDCICAAATSCLPAKGFTPLISPKAGGRR